MALFNSLNTCLCSNAMLLIWLCVCVCVCVCVWERQERRVSTQDAGRETLWTRGTVEQAVQRPFQDQWHMGEGGVRVCRAGGGQEPRGRVPDNVWRVPVCQHAAERGGWQREKVSRGLCVMPDIVRVSWTFAVSCDLCGKRTACGHKAMLFMHHDKAVVLHLLMQQCCNNALTMLVCRFTILLRTEKSLQLLDATAIKFSILRSVVARGW